MVDLAETRLTFDEFLIWAEGREGKWELVDGSPRAMSPERVRMEKGTATVTRDGSLEAKSASAEFIAKNGGGACVRLPNPGSKSSLNEGLHPRRPIQLRFH